MCKVGADVPEDCIGSDLGVECESMIRRGIDRLYYLVPLYSTATGVASWALRGPKSGRWSRRQIITVCVEVEQQR